MIPTPPKRQSINLSTCHLGLCSVVLCAATIVIPRQALPTCAHARVLQALQGWLKATPHPPHHSGRDIILHASKRAAAGDRCVSDRTLVEYGDDAPAHVSSAGSTRLRSLTFVLPFPPRLEPTPAMPHKLDILVVGAGLSGLAAAIQCALSGHSVTVLEGARELAEVCAHVYDTRWLQSVSILTSIPDRRRPSTYT